LSPSREKVVVGMSGGVDSSVAAALLVEEGFEVEGLSLRLQPCQDDQENRSCCGIQGLACARAVADKLGIPHLVRDLRRRFAQVVLRGAWDDYARGRTPNPCVVCNRMVKFKALQERAEEIGATWIATGHHARVIGTGSAELLRGRDGDKDQAYFLCRLSREQLAMTRLPIGGLTKAEVRELARKLELPAAGRPESQDACLESLGLGFAEALRLRFGAPARPGEVVDTEGNVLGTHAGIHRFTIGQRRGLGIASGDRLHVVAIDHLQARVIATAEEQRLFSTSCVLSDVVWLSEAQAGQSFEAEVQIRSRHRAAGALIEPVVDRAVLVRFHDMQRAVTPGQAAAIYKGERLLGAGWIESAAGGLP